MSVTVKSKSLKILCLFSAGFSQTRFRGEISQKIGKNLRRYAIFGFLGAFLIGPLTARAKGPSAGFLFDEFDLTLELGHRTEAGGPFYYSETRDTRHTWAISPFFSYDEDPATESKEYDILYPLLTYDRFGEQYRWEIFQLFAFSGGPTQNEAYRDRLTIFPFYFQQRSADPKQDYTAFFPIYGHLKNRLFREEVFFVVFPIYLQSKKADVVTDNYVYPFVHVRRGNSLEGWQFWPFYGTETKGVTTKTNGFGDVQLIGGHDKSFIMWPLYFDTKAGIGTANPEHNRGSIPFFAYLRSPQRDSTTVLWPFFSHIDDREKKYREWELPWPFVVFARGEGKTTDRVFPFFSRSHSPILESDFYMWPIYKFNRVHSDPLDRKRTRICYFLFSKVIEKNTETGADRRRMDLWPLFTYHKDFNGNSWLQILAPLEPLVPNNKSIERDYSQLWSLWRSQHNPRTGAKSQSLLWNLYRRDTTPTTKKTSALFGLFQTKSDDKSQTLRLFYIPITKTKAKAKGS